MNPTCKKRLGAFVWKYEVVAQERIASIFELVLEGEWLKPCRQFLHLRDPDDAHLTVYFNFVLTRSRQCHLIYQWGLGRYFLRQGMCDVMGPQK